MSIPLFIHLLDDYIILGEVWREYEWKTFFYLIG